MSDRVSTYQPIQMQVRGKSRTVHLESPFLNGKARARTYVSGKTVSGTVSVNKSGAKRFTALGVNAGLLG